MLKAVYSLYRYLFERDCAHGLVKPFAGGGFCPDCGYWVQIIWQLLRCRTCSAKRHARLTPDQKVRPVHQYCHHCGSADYQLTKRTKIHVYEMPYAVCLKEINYDESTRHATHAKRYRNAGHHPFHTDLHYQNNPAPAPPIVEGKVLKKVELTRPGRFA